MSNANYNGKTGQQEKGNETSNALLSGSNITKKFDGLVAVDDVSFSLMEGHIYGLIGPNGAGKSTLFNVVTGYHSPTNGTIMFKGTKITKEPPEAVNEIGIGRTFQLVRLFQGMSVYENVKVGAYFGQNEEVEKETRQSLEQVGLWDQRNKDADSLPLAAQKKVEISRSLA
ncbi:MAG: ABC transporter ATP-binding protein, partial [Halobacteriaceae archaeon]